MIACRTHEHAAEIGYVLSRSYWGRGYVTEAAKAVVDWAVSPDFIFRFGPCAILQTSAPERVLDKVRMERKAFSGDG
jgi:[ribosomal protein S5]-alanine N-acetyltransferase